MSLINDALRKARAAQNQTAAPEPPTPHFRSPDPVEPARRGLGLLLPVVLGVVALLLLAAVWIWSQRRGELVVRAKLDPAEPQPVAMRVHPTPVVAAKPETVQPGPSPSLAAAPAKVASPATPAPATQLALATPTAPSVGNTSAVPHPEAQPAPAMPATVVSNLVAVTNAAPPVPTPPKLMGIIFNPRRPSAVINGKTLFVGERFGDQRVQAITADTCLLVGGGKTNLLSLDD